MILSHIFIPFPSIIYYALMTSIQIIEIINRMGQSQCFEALNPPNNLTPQPLDLNLRLIQLQEDPQETNIKPQHLTFRTNYSKRLGDCEEGDFITARPQLSPEIRQRFQSLESIEQECYRRLRAQRGVSEPNKYFRFGRTGVVYEGEWLNSKPHGFGRNYYPSGGVYEGTFISGIPHGYGRFINANGHYYQGEVKYGRGNGEGIYMATSILFKGNFKDNALHGEGEEKGNDYYFKGSFEYGSKKHGVFKYSGNVYEGPFDNDEFEGEGVLATAEGRYVGNFHQGLQHGYGEFEWKNGSKYRGNYVRGMRDGDGEFYNAETKTICRGIWRRGLLEGEGEYQQPRGNLNKVVWKQSQIASFR